MVKVLLCHHFHSQTVVPCGSEPVAVHASPEKLFVATVDRRVEVYDLGQAACPRIHWFNTEATVVQITHNVPGDYLATLETKKSRLKEYRFIKVYLNWQVDPGKQPMKVRIAGKPYGVNVKDLKAGKAEVIDVPFSGQVATIATCQRTTTLAIAVNNAVHLYQLVDKTLSNTNHTYTDVELFLEITWDSPISSVAICEDHIACLTEKVAHLVRLSYQDGGQKLQGVATLDEIRATTPLVLSPSSRHQERATLERAPIITSDSNQNKLRHGYLIPPSVEDPNLPSVVAGFRKYSNFGVRSSPNLSSSLTISSEQTTSKPWNNAFGKIENDDNYVVWDFSDDGKLSEDTRALTSRARNIPGARAQGKTIFLKGFHAPSSSSPPLSVPLQGKPHPPSVSDKRGGAVSTAGEVIVTVLIQLEQNNNDKYKGMQLIPTHGAGKPEVSGQCTSSSSSVPIRTDMAGLCCFLESSYSGVMYTVTPKPQLISNYKFTSEALKVVCGHSLIHVVTRVSVETYTARCNAAAVHNTETLDNITTSFPSTDLETCLVSIQTFIGIRQVALSGRYLHLLTKVESKAETKKGPKGQENNWSLYVLKSSTGADLYKDMITLGTKNQESSPPTYLHLLQEGHMALKSDLVAGGSGDITIEDLLRESCALLGDYYSQLHCSDWRLALPYYKMSGLRIEDVVRQASLHKQINKQQLPCAYGKGLTNYLNFVLFEDSDKEKIQQTWCDAILELYSEAEPDDLSRVMLFSKYQEYDAAKAVSLLENSMSEQRNREDRNRSTDLLCIAILNLRLCEPDKALSALSAISKGEVIRFCVDNHQLLHRDYTELSPLAQLMRRHYPQVFITILVSLQDTSTIPLEQALVLLKSNVYQSEVHRNAHVKEYIEVLLNDQKREHLFDEAVKILGDIYIRRLIEWKAPSSREFPLAQFLMPRGTGYFGQRFSWLDYLPPFTDPSAMKQPCFYLQFAKAGPRSKVMSQPIKIAKRDATKTACRCCQCNEDLLKLQSLLSSQFVTEEFVRLVLDKIRSKNSSLMGFESLWIICIVHIDFRQAIDIVVEKYPAVLPEFVIGCVGSDIEKVRYTVESILCALRKSANYATTHDDVCVESFKGILSEMSAMLTPKEFLSLLPADGSLLMFLPYIQRCCQEDEKRQLKAEIVRKGDCLKTNV